MYPQEIPLKETQADLHLATNDFNSMKTKDPKPSYDSMPTIPTSTSSLLSLQDSSMHISHSPLSL